MSEGKAVFIGILVVNIPVLLLLICPLFILLYFNPEPGILGFIVFILGFSFAWLWWSIMIPKWRLWAYEQVDSIYELKQKATNAGLTWPDRSIFEKSEIKSTAHRARERELEKNA